MIIRPVYFHRKQIQVTDGPVALGIQEGMKVRPGRSEELTGLKAVEPQQPVRLVKPVFSFQRGTLGKHGQRGILVHVDEGGVKDPASDQNCDTGAWAVLRSS